MKVNNKHIGNDVVDHNQQEQPKVELTSSYRSAPWWVLPILVACQFGGTSVWFTGSAVLDGMAKGTTFEDNIGHVTSSVQAGFLTGTVTFAITSAADRIPPTRLFMRCAILGAATNISLIFLKGSVEKLGGFITLLILRFLTGVSLAGIYPVGMKVASDWYPQGLGHALGFLIGAVVLGTAIPSLLKSIDQPWGWEGLVYETTFLSTIGGLVMGFLVPNGPARKASTKFDPVAVMQLLTLNAKYRAACFGYVAHMWEVYGFWALVVEQWEDYALRNGSDWDKNIVAFCAIAIGAVGSVVAGYASRRYGSAIVGSGFLATSGLCCLLSPLVYYLPEGLALMFYLFWGFAVVADTAQFSTLAAQTVPAHLRGSALTMSTAIGFGVSIITLQILELGVFSKQFMFQILSVGPVIGVWAMWPLVFPRAEEGEQEREEDQELAEDRGQTFGSQFTTVAGSHVDLGSQLTFAESNVDLGSQFTENSVDCGRQFGRQLLSERNVDLEADLGGEVTEVASDVS